MTQPASSFEAAVGGFLSGYSTVADIRDRRAEAARAERAARQAEQLRQIQIQDSGYQEVDFTLPPDPSKRQGFVSRIGNRLLGRDTEPERDVRLLKMGPSAAERAVAQTREFQVADREDGQAHTATGWARDDARAAADRAARAAEAEASRRTQLGVAGIYAGASQRADLRANAETDREDRDRFLGELAAATGGDPRKMMGLVEARPDLMAKARRWKIPGFAYSAAGGAFRQQRRLNDATVFDKMQETDDQRRARERREAEEREARARGAGGGATTKETITRAEAAALRQQGFSDAQITAKYTVR